MDYQLGDHGCGYPLRCITDRSACDGVRSDEPGCTNGKTSFFSDESRFCLRHHDGGIRVWRHSGKRTLQACIRHRHTCVSPGVMVWVAIGYTSRSPLIRIDGTKRQEELCLATDSSYIVDNGIETLAVLWGFEKFRYFLYGCKTREYTAHSLDLSPTENVLSMVVEQFARHNPPVTTLDELWYRVEAAWASVPVHAIKVLFDSMPRRIKAVITARGAVLTRLCPVVPQYPIIALYPWPVQSGPAYALTFSLQVLCGGLFTMTHLACDTFLLSLLIYICSQIDVLCASLRQLGRRLLRIVSLVSYRYVGVLQQVLSPVALAQFMCSMVIICLSGFGIAISNDFGSLCRYSVYFTGAAIQLLLFCWYGEVLITKSEHVSEAAMACGWPAVRRGRFQSSALLLMVRAQRPLALTGSKFYVVSLKTFVQVTNAIITYFKIAPTLGK
uniref:Odorant receptor n=1 Tax=Locusta migratoria TaxID=7004 RepID=A0A0M4JMG5_LOCMI|nr:odorant receptor 8 [Locusta migratoria]